ncbi:MAG: hypothetical protein A3F91_09445 [Flavobacteria bacterium RIFCSPLOWO2_12_FULL_35_11]|nr:MAG: hypothetical protein A3F91_09445 [Flavobacteria bacterium RIFCSPLOWO2_12_FULL_35_11]
MKIENQKRTRSKLTWLEFFTEVKEFYELNGCLPAKDLTDTHEKRLQIWCNNQKQLFKDNKLSADRVQMLLGISSEILKDRRTSLWDNTFRTLKVFFQENGVLPTTLSKDSLEKKLAGWVQTQKLVKKDGKMNLEREKLLLEFLPTFFQENRGHGYSDDEWAENFGEFKKFFELNNRLPSKYSINKDNKEELILANWVGTQRLNYRNKNILPEREKLLLEVYPAFFIVREMKRRYCVSKRRNKPKF